MEKIISLSHLGLLKVSGTGALALLQGQVTCDVKEISPTHSSLGALCNPQGRIISLFRLFIFEDAYYLQMLREMVPITFNILKKYAVFFKVELMDASDMLLQWGWIGKNNHNYSKDTVVIPISESRYAVIGKQQFTPNTTLQTWFQLDMEEHLPTIYPDTSEKFLPHELNLPQLNAISFTKGCYTGQEIIARMQYRGKLKKQLTKIRLHMNTEPKRGEECQAGCIVDYATIDSHTYDILCLQDIRI